MDEAENVVRLLGLCVNEMKTGKFTRQDLIFIKELLERMLQATEKVLKATNG